MQCKPLGTFSAFVAVGRLNTRSMSLAALLTVAVTRCFFNGPTKDTSKLSAPFLSAFRCTMVMSSVNDVNTSRL